ncbi:MAG: beta-xylosidase [Acidobacteria bacterium]|nr:MAG: beta-xylosidase [Acidobacteriota bacterium]
MMREIKLEAEKRMKVPRRILFIAAMISALTPVNSNVGQALSTPVTKVRPTVTIEVDASKPSGPLPRIWSYFGYDEPNFTYSANGKKLLKELAQLSPVPIYLRTHNLFTSGDGTGSLKWGSTNAYTEDPRGQPVYDWTIVDRIFDAYQEVGARPLVEIGFMPEALTTGPPPYRHNFPKDFATGWSYPPKDYVKWAELVSQFAKHLRERYGVAAVKMWLWEVWNEPDIFYWHGTPEEYFQLYDVSADAIRRVLPGASIGGPDSTGPGNLRAANFLRLFLDHCAHGKNYATGKTGAPLDFISFHPKGSPEWVDGHVRMGPSEQLKAIDAGFKIVGNTPEWRNTPIILGENDPEGCAACSAKERPQNAYRNESLYGAYTVVILDCAMKLAKEDGVNLQGSVTWAFQFDGQPYFEGLRELTTNGIDKPVLNAFRMLGLLGETRLTVTSGAAISVREIEQKGVTAQPDLDAVAARKEKEVEVLVVNYHDHDVPSDATAVDLILKGLPARLDRALVEQYRLDATHSNAYTLWKQMGQPLQPTSEQYERLEIAGRLEMEGPPDWARVVDGTVRRAFSQPREGLSLFLFKWDAK